MNIVVLIVIGVIIADLLRNIQGTNAILKGFTSFWQTGVNGMLGQTTTGNFTGQQAAA